MEFAIFSIYLLMLRSLPLELYILDGKTSYLPEIMFVAGKSITDRRKGTNDFFFYF